MALRVTASFLAVAMMATSASRVLAFAAVRLVAPLGRPRSSDRHPVRSECECQVLPGTTDEAFDPRAPIVSPKHSEHQFVVPHLEAIR